MLVGGAFPGSGSALPGDAVHAWSPSGGPPPGRASHGRVSPSSRPPRHPPSAPSLAHRYSRTLAGVLSPTHPGSPPVPAHEHDAWRLGMSTQDGGRTAFVSPPLSCRCPRPCGLCRGRFRGAHRGPHADSPGRMTVTARHSQGTTRMFRPRSSPHSNSTVTRRGGRRMRAAQSTLSGYSRSSIRAPRAHPPPIGARSPAASDASLGLLSATSRRTIASARFGKENISGPWSPASRFGRVDHQLARLLQLASRGAGTVTGTLDRAPAKHGSAHALHATLVRVQIRAPARMRGDRTQHNRAPRSLASSSGVRLGTRCFT